MVMIRLASVLVVLVVAAKATLFVADDARVFDVEALGAIEKRLSQLVDEAVRYREEERERREKAMRLSLAHRLTAVRRAVMWRAQALARLVPITRRRSGACVPSASRALCSPVRAEANFGWLRNVSRLHPKVVSPRVLRAAHAQQITHTLFGCASQHPA